MVLDPTAHLGVGVILQRRKPRNGPGLELGKQRYADATQKPRQPFRARHLSVETLVPADEVAAQGLEVFIRQRRQFGQTIGSFQAIQHRLADVLVNVEQAHSLALAALGATMEGEANAPVLVSAAKARVNHSIQFVSDQAVQLHGGIGTTQELPLNRYFRRAMAIAREFGGTSQHLARVEAALAERTQSSRTAA